MILANRLYFWIKITSTTHVKTKAKTTMSGRQQSSPAGLRLIGSHAYQTDPASPHTREQSKINLS